MSDQFKVSVMVELQDRFSNGLKSISNALNSVHSQMSGMNSHIQHFQKMQQAYSQIASVGQAMQGAGVTALKAMIDPAKEYNHQLNLMKMNGLSHIEILRNQQAAWKTAGLVPTSTPAGNLAGLSDLRTVFVGKNAAEEGRDLLPTFQKSQAVLDASAHTLKGHSSHDIVFSMAKAIEMMGQLNPEKFKHHMDMMTRVMVATGGRVTPENYQNTLKYARMAKMNLGEDFLYKKLPELIIEMQNAGGKGGGGGGPGALIAAAFRQTVMGTLNKAAVANLMGLGLLNHPVLKTTTTGTKIMGSDGVVGDKVFANDPEKWVNQYLVPSLISHHKAKAGDTKGILMAIAQTFKGNQNAVTLYQELYSKQAQFGKFATNMQGVGSTDQLYKQSQEDPDQAFKALDASFLTLRTAIGQHVLPVIVPGITGLAAAINNAGQYLQSHPQIASTIANLTLAFTAVGGAISTVAGFMATDLALKLAGTGLTVLRFCGWIGLAVAAVAGLIYVVQHWKEISGKLKTKIDEVKGRIAVWIVQFPGLLNNLAQASSMCRDFANSVGQVVTKVTAALGGLRAAVGIYERFTMTPLQYSEKYDPKWRAATEKVDEQERQQSIAAVSRAISGDQRSGGKVVVTNHNSITINSKSGNSKDIAKEVMDKLSNGMSRMVSSHPIAGGDRNSVHFAGAH